MKNFWFCQKLAYSKLSFMKYTIASKWILLSPMLQKLTKGWEGWKIQGDSWKWKVLNNFIIFIIQELYA